MANPAQQVDELLTVRVPDGTLRKIAEELRQNHGYEGYTAEQLEEAVREFWTAEARHCAEAFIALLCLRGNFGLFRQILRRVASNPKPIPDWFASEVL